MIENLKAKKHKFNKLPNIYITSLFLEILSDNKKIDFIYDEVINNCFKNQIINKKDLYFILEKELENIKNFLINLEIIDQKNKVKNMELFSFLLDKQNLFNLYFENDETLLDLINDDISKSINAINVENWAESTIKDLLDKKVINNITNDKKLVQLIKENKKGYIGFDPTAKSLHLGNYVMINVLNILNKNGIQTIPMVGGATGMIGDPSGKNQERNLLDIEKIIENKKSIIQQIKKLTNANLVIDNIENYEHMSFLDFLRTVGKLININYMLEKDVIKSRLETGISFTEFSYTLIQGYDFLQFYKKYDVALQIGGSDQWGNITTGVELIRKELGDQNLATGLTINLLLKNDGTKFGKSEKGAIFLDNTLTSSYEMYQFLLNQSDDDILKLFDFITPISNFEKAALKHFWNSNNIKKNRLLQKSLAKLLVKLIHSNEEYENSLKITKSLFLNNLEELTIEQLDIAFANAEKINFEKNFKKNIVDFLIEIGACNSKRESRELIQNNSISINNKKINSLEYIVNIADSLHKKYLIVKKGKKTNFIINLI